MICSYRRSLSGGGVTVESSPIDVVEPARSLSRPFPVLESTEMIVGVNSVTSVPLDRVACLRTSVKNMEHPEISRLPRPNEEQSSKGGKLRRQRGFFGVNALRRRLGDSLHSCEACVRLRFVVVSDHAQRHEEKFIGFVNS